MGKKTVFIKRYPSKGEFPKEDDFAVLTKNGKMFGFDVTERTEWWLEEIELPSDTDVYRIYSETNTRAEIELIKKGANLIINHLKANTNGN